MADTIADLLANISQPTWLADDAGHWTWSNPCWTDVTGLSAQASRGQDWYRAVHPNDVEATRVAWERATRTGVLDVDHRFIDVRTGDDARWFHTHAAPTPGIDAARAGVGFGSVWLGICTDIHKLKMMEERQAAVQRRVDGLLSLTRAVARRTAAATRTKEDYALHLDSRLDAIARTHRIMSRHDDAGINLEHLITDALLAHGVHGGQGVAVCGPDVTLPGKLGELMSLTVHELAMNAVKHGALSGRAGDGDGDIAIRWRLDDDGPGTVLRFEWLEPGVAALDAPRHHGYGTELIERVLPAELGATTALGIDASRVSCTIDLPLA